MPFFKKKGGDFYPKKKTFFKPQGLFSDPPRGFPLLFNCIFTTLGGAILFSFKIFPQKKKGGGVKKKQIFSLALGFFFFLKLN